MRIRPQTTVHSPQHIELELNPTFIWVRAANRRHILEYNEDKKLKLGCCFLLSF